jgi:hypothetical protein
MQLGKRQTVGRVVVAMGNKLSPLPTAVLIRIN